MTIPEIRVKTNKPLKQLVLEMHAKEFARAKKYKKLFKQMRAQHTRQLEVNDELHVQVDENCRHNKFVMQKNDELQETCKTLGEKLKRLQGRNKGYREELKRLKAKRTTSAGTG